MACCFWGEKKGGRKTFSEGVLYRVGTPGKEKSAEEKVVEKSISSFHKGGAL